jgi:hypothetical protein
MEQSNKDFSNRKANRLAVMPVIAGGFLLLAFYFFFRGVQDEMSYRNSFAGLFFDPPLSRSILFAMLFLGLALGTVIGSFFSDRDASLPGT